jgi:hypothetical protein
VIRLQSQALDLGHQLGDPGLELLDGWPDLPLRKPPVDVLRAVHVPRLDREQDRPLRDEKWVAQPREGWVAQARGWNEKSFWRARPSGVGVRSSASRGSQVKRQQAPCRSRGPNASVCARAMQSIPGVLTPSVQRRIFSCFLS